MPSWGEFPGPGSSMLRETVTAITENGGAVGTTNVDGDIPDLSGTPSEDTLAEAVRELATKLNEIIAAVGG